MVAEVLLLGALAVPITACRADLDDCDGPPPCVSSAAACLCWTIVDDVAGYVVRQDGLEVARLPCETRLGERRCRASLPLVRAATWPIVPGSVSQWCVAAYRRTPAALLEGPGSCIEIEWSADPVLSFP